MKAFISHSHAQADDADALALALRGAGHKAVLDRDFLKGGDEFHAALRKAIQSADLFVFLISPQSVREGSFARAEVEFFRQRWNNPMGRVLPVMWVETPLADVPPYLQAPTILRPGGNPVAETTARVTDIARARRMRWLPGCIGGVAVAGVVAAVWWPHKIEPAPSCLLRAELISTPARATTVDAGIAGSPRSFIVGADRVAQLDIGGLTAASTVWTLDLGGVDGRSLGRFELRGCPPSKVDLDDGHGTQVRIEPRH
jgi:hypothetical protein